VTVEMDASEAKAVRDDLDFIPFSKVSPSGAKLCNLLEALYGRETL
jgi:hypothetical protein